MAKKNHIPQTSTHTNKSDELDLLHKSLGDDLDLKDLGDDVLITTEESITVTLFDDSHGDEEDEDGIDSLFVNKKTKKTVADEDDVEDFDSYFFEE